MKLIFLTFRLCCALFTGSCVSSTATTAAEASAKPDLSERQKAKLLPPGFKFEIIPGAGYGATHRYVLTLPSGEEHTIFQPPATQPHYPTPEEPDKRWVAAPIDTLVIAAIVDGDWFAAAVPGAEYQGWFWLRWNIPQKKAEPAIFFGEPFFTASWPKFRNAHVIEYRHFTMFLLTITDNHQVLADGKPRIHMTYGDGWAQGHDEEGKWITRGTCGHWPGAAEYISGLKSVATIILRPDTKMENLPPNTVLDPLSPPRPNPSTGPANSGENRWGLIAFLAIIVLVAVRLFTRRQSTR